MLPFLHLLTCQNRHLAGGDGGSVKGSKGKDFEEDDFPAKSIVSARVGWTCSARGETSGGRVTPALRFKSATTVVTSIEFLETMTTYMMNDDFFCFQKKLSMQSPGLQGK